MKLPNIITALDNPNLPQVIKKEIEQLDTNLLPLQQGLSLSSYVADNPVNTTILSITDTDNTLDVKAGIFYTGIIAGCSCADDPTPQDVQNEYCEILITINKNNAEAAVVLVE